MVGFTVRTAGDGLNHTARSDQLTGPIRNQRIAIYQLGADVTGSTTGLGTGNLQVGLQGIDTIVGLPGSTVAPSEVTYRHSDPSQVTWNDLGKVLVISVVWSPDDYEPE